MVILREIAKMTVEKMIKVYNLSITDKEKIDLIEKIAYEHSQKYNYCYANKCGSY